MSRPLRDPHDIHPDVRAATCEDLEAHGWGMVERHRIPANWRERILVPQRKPVMAERTEQRPRRLSQLAAWTWEDLA